MKLRMNIICIYSLHSSRIWIGRIQKSELQFMTLCVSGLTKESMASGNAQYHAFLAPVPDFELPEWMLSISSAKSQAFLMQKSRGQIKNFSRDTSSLHVAPDFMNFSGHSERFWKSTKLSPWAKCLALKIRKTFWMPSDSIVANWTWYSTLRCKFSNPNTFIMPVLTSLAVLI